MTATIPPTAVGPGPNGGKSLVGIPVKIVAGLVAFALAALIGYGIGSRHGSSGPHILTGRAYVGDAVASVSVDGWAYGFGITPDGLPWYDEQGGYHEGGVPPCLQDPPGHYAWIRFGYSTASGLHGDSWRSVDWVQCLPHHP